MASSSRDASSDLPATMSCQTRLWRTANASRRFARRRSAGSPGGRRRSTLRSRRAGRGSMPSTHQRTPFEMQVAHHAVDPARAVDGAQRLVQPPFGTMQRGGEVEVLGLFERLPGAQLQVAGGGGERLLGAGEIGGRPQGVRRPSPGAGAEILDERARRSSRCRGARRSRRPSGRARARGGDRRRSPPNPVSSSSSQNDQLSKRLLLRSSVHWRGGGWRRKSRNCSAAMRPLLVHLALDLGDVRQHAADRELARPTVVR